MLYTKGKPIIPEKLPIREIKWEPLIPLMGQANRAISLYDGILHSLPNAEILLSPLTTQEAVLSSRIEGTQATLGDVFRLEAGVEPEEEATRQDIGEIMNYRMALYSADEELKTRPFTLNLLLKLHDILLNSVRGRNKGRGRFRTDQNWIGPPNCKIEDAEFVPPDPMQVMELMDNWEKYYHLERPDPLVQLAVIHAQFEIIHPFLDGNGRLGRILIPLFLFEKRIVAKPMFYISQYLEEHRDEYAGSLRAIGQEADGWNKWIMFFLRALAEQAKQNTETARAIKDLYEKLKGTVLERMHSAYSVPVLDALFARPIIRSTDLKGKTGMPTAPMIILLLERFEQEGILKIIQEGSGRRPYVFAFPELINLCEGRKVF